MDANDSEDDIKWRRIDPTTSHKVGWREVVTKTFVLPSGQSTTFDTFGPEGQHHVCVIALTKEKMVVIAKQFRAGPEKIMFELPGGSVGKDEAAEIAAKRELLEETGYSHARLEYLGPFLKDGYMNAVWHAFMAYDCELIQSQVLDNEEYIKVQLTDIAGLVKLAKSASMTDSQAVLMAYDKLMAL